MPVMNWKAGDKYEPGSAPGDLDKEVAAQPDEVTKHLQMPEGRLPPQHQEKLPGDETQMYPAPVFIRDYYKGAGKLTGKVALITGGDSGIGRAVAVHFAREGADVAFIYLDADMEGEDAKKTEQLIQAEGRRSFSMVGDVGDPKVCQEVVRRTVETLGHLDILVNNAGEQHRIPDIKDMKPETIERTFKTNILSHFYMSQAALEHIPEQTGCIINTSSLVAYMGEPNMMDYAATKGGVMAFTRSLAQQLLPKGIRVNAVAPGPVWTNVNMVTVPKENISTELQNLVPMKRVAQPAELAPAYVLLASEDGSFITGQTIHVNGGMPGYC